MNINVSFQRSIFPYWLRANPELLKTLTNGHFSITYLNESNQLIPGINTGKLSDGLASTIFFKGKCEQTVEKLMMFNWIDIFHDKLREGIVIQSCITICAVNGHFYSANTLSINCSFSNLCVYKSQRQFFDIESLRLLRKALMSSFQTSFHISNLFVYSIPLSRI